jgi:hypothetical protein
MKRGKPSGGYDKKTQSHDVAGVMDALEVLPADVMGDDYWFAGRVLI